MKLMIGDNIKHLRREKDITQEQLAEILGVSYQSVSRWENNACYPDMELLPTMAGFFETTVDKLLGVNEQLEKGRVQEYIDRFQVAVSRGDIEKCICIAREGVGEYPNNYTLLNKLMYALFLATDDDGNIPDWKENRIKYDAEITALGERIMKYCPDQTIRNEAVGRLAFHHCEMGRKKIGRTIYETLPSQAFCKEAQIWWGLEREEKLPHTRKRIRTGADMIFDSMHKMGWAKLISDEELLQVYEKKLALLDLIYDGNYPNNDWFIANVHFGMARVYARLGKTDKMFQQLRLTADSAIDFDNRPESGKCSCLLLGEIAWKRTDHETDDSRPLCEIVRDKWLADKDFDGVREMDEFQKILEIL